MRTVETFLVVSQLPVVVTDAGVAISYSPGQTFRGVATNPSIERLLEQEKIVRSSDGAETTGYTIVVGPAGPTGPTGPTGPASAAASLSDVLTVGNTTGANDLIVSTGQAIRGQTDALFYAADAAGAVPGGVVDIGGGEGSLTQPGGSVEIFAGGASGGSTPGNLELYGGYGAAAAPGGHGLLSGGATAAPGENAGDAIVRGGENSGAPANHGRVLIGDTFTRSVLIGDAAAGQTSIQGIGFNQSGQTALHAAYTGATRNSIIGALNALVDGTIVAGAETLAGTLSAGNTTGANNIIVSTGQKITGATDLTLDAIGSVLIEATGDFGSLELYATGDGGWVYINGGHQVASLGGVVIEGGDADGGGGQVFFGGGDGLVGASVGGLALIYGGRGGPTLGVGGNVEILSGPGGINLGNSGTAGDVLIDGARGTGTGLHGRVLVGATDDGSRRTRAVVIGDSGFATQTVTIYNVDTINSIAVTQSGQTALHATYTGATRNSLVGALNALVDGTIALGGGESLSATLAIGNTTGANDIVISTGQRLTSQTTLLVRSADNGTLDANGHLLTVRAGDVTNGIGNGGAVLIESGLPVTGQGGASGDLTIRTAAVNTFTSEASGGIFIESGAAESGSGGLFLKTGNSDTDTTGTLDIRTGDSGGTSASGDIMLTTGSGYGTGSIIITATVPGPGGGGHISVDAAGSCDIDGDIAVNIGVSSPSIQIGSANNNSQVFIDAQTSISINAATIGFFGAGGAAQDTVAGSRAGNAALADLLTKLSNLGLILDGTDP